MGCEPHSYRWAMKCLLWYWIFWKKQLCIICNFRFVIFMTHLLYNTLMFVLQKFFVQIGTTKKTYIMFLVSKNVCKCTNSSTAIACAKIVMMQVFSFKFQKKVFFWDGKEILWNKTVSHGSNVFWSDNPNLFTIGMTFYMKITIKSGHSFAHFMATELSWCAEL